MSEPRGFTKRTVLILLLVFLVLFGLGAGVIDIGDSEPPEGTPTPTPVTETTSDPGQPTVTVTPPATATPETERSTDTPTETPTGTSTGTPTATASPKPSLNASIRVDASSPDDVANDDGFVGPLWGSVSGALTWNGSVDSIVVVVNVVEPGEGWVERQRVMVRPETDSLSLEDLLDGPRYRYLDGDQTRGFDNPTGGTTATRTGALSVTAVLFEDGQERTRVTDTAVYRFEVTNTVGAANTDGVAISVSDSSDGTESAEAVPSDGGFVPGATANRSMTVENTGRFAGTVRVFVTNLRGSENGFAEPEAAVDDDSASELLEQIQLRIAVVDDDGKHYVLGGPAAWIDLVGSVEEGDQITSFGLEPGENRTIFVEWTVPKSAGNEIMTDTANWDVEFVFESAGAD